MDCDHSTMVTCKLPPATPLFPDPGINAEIRSIPSVVLYFRHVLALLMYDFCHWAFSSSCTATTILSLFQSNLNRCL